jgi:hypothetical protein
MPGVVVRVSSSGATLLGGDQVSDGGLGGGLSRHSHGHSLTHVNDCVERRCNLGQHCISFGGIGIDEISADESTEIL